MLKVIHTCCVEVEDPRNGVSSPDQNSVRLRQSSRSREHITTSIPTSTYVCQGSDYQVILRIGIRAAKIQACSGRGATGNDLGSPCSLRNGSNGPSRTLSEQIRQSCECLGWDECFKEAMEEGLGRSCEKREKMQVSHFLSRYPTSPIAPLTIPAMQTRGCPSG